MTVHYQPRAAGELSEAGQLQHGADQQHAVRNLTRVTVHQLCEVARELQHGAE